MSIRNFQSNFTAGEFSPLLEGRTDFAKYANSLYCMENFLSYPHGPATLRPGFKYLAGTKVNATASRLIPFVFSESDAFVLEFGANYIRFMHNRAQITLSYAAWTTTTYYKVGQLVSNSGSYYRCLIAHTSGTFATDLAAAKWAATSGASDTIYELYSPYAAADVAKIKYCQSCDVLYLFHPSYAPRKLMRVSDSEWSLQTINFRPPPLVLAVHYLNATLTPSATTGDNVTFTASAAVFLTGDIGRQIKYGAGRAIINTVYSATVITCDIIDDFPTTSAIASGAWSLSGYNQGYLTPNIYDPGKVPNIGERISVAVTDADTADTWVNINTKGNSDWEKSGTGTYLYYLKSTASGYVATEPDKVKINRTVLATPNAGGPGGLSAWSDWAFGDIDTLGYNTIYLFAFDPDAADTGEYKRTSAAETRTVFRAADVGKYITMHGGVFKITEVTDSKNIVCEVVKMMNADDAWEDTDSDGDPDAVVPTWDWVLYETMWSVANGYPSCGAFFEDRLITAGVTAYPENIRGSVVGDYENYSPGTEEDDAYDFSINGKTVSLIRWIDPREYLVFGTVSSEWMLGSNESGKSSITPTNVDAKRQTTCGCADIDPVAINHCTLFVQSFLRKIREFTLNPTSVNTEYVAPDLTMLAEHMTVGNIAGMCYQQEPFSIVWVWMADGALASLTYLREEEVVGWASHPMDGDVESMCSIPGTGYDEVYAIVEHTINSATVRYIEVLEKICADDDTTFQANKGLNAFYVDCGITYNSTATTVITGLSHLEGEAVSVLADGAVKTGHTVASGQITLATAASVVHVGLDIAGKITTMRPALSLNDGTSQGKMMRIINLIIRVLNSGTFKAGRDATNVDEYGFASYDQTAYQVLFATSDTPLGSPVALYTGDKKIPFDDEFNRDGRLSIIQDKPLPLNIVAINAEIEFV